MNRFRKKSDARNSTRQSNALAAGPSSAPPFQQHFQHYQQSQHPVLALPNLTPGDEFRSSVIIPDLGRRFSILNRNGILAADRIRSKLAEQRASGDENRITEEEEDLLMSALSTLQVDRSHSATVSSAPPGETSFPASIMSLHSAFSTAESTSTSLYPMSSPTLTGHDAPFSANGTPRSYKRASNNLFGSGQFRDRSYIRAVKSSSSSNSSTRSPASSSTGTAGERMHRGSSEPEQFSQIDETSEVEQSPGLGEDHQTRIQVPTMEDRAGYTASGSEASSGSGSSDHRRVLHGTGLTFDQAWRVSRALEHVLSSLSSEDENGDPNDDETILAPPLARSFPKGSNSNQNHGPLLPSQHHHPHPHPQQSQQQQPQQQHGIQSQSQSQIQNQTIRTEDIKAMLSYLSQTDIGLRALREMPEPAEITSPPISTTTTTTYSSQQHHHHQQPFLESDFELESDSAASATSSSSSPYPPRNATASPVPDSSQRVPGYVPGMHRPITPQRFGNGVWSGTTGGEFDSDDYSTTPRATSPTNMFRHDRERERAGSAVSAMLMSIRPRMVGGMREGGSTHGIVMEGTSSIEGVLSGERDRRSSLDSPTLTTSDLRRRPASPLSQVHTVASAPASRPSTGGSTSAQVNAILSHPPSNPNANVNANARTPDATHSPSGSKSESNYSTGPGHSRVGSLSSNPDLEHEQDHASTEVYAGGSGLARSKSIASRSLASPALPESPLIDNERNLYHGGSGSQSWDNSSSKSMPPISVGPSLLYKNATAGGSRPSTPNIQRPTTPGLGGQRSSTPVGAAGTTVARSPTPNYLLQRSPSAAGYHSEHDQTGSAMGTTTRTQHQALGHTNSIRTTPSHTSSSSASNPLLRSSLDNSSRSSLESVGSSYHSSDGEMEDKKAKMLMTLLFEPDSERARLVRRRLDGLTGSNSSLGGPGEGKKVNWSSFMNDGERDESGHGQHNGSDSPVSALGDQEDTLQLLTGLTKKDVATIQQKLVSAYVTREASNALKASQRRRRPSVQSRDLATSPTPRPAVGVNTTNVGPSIAPSADVTTQQPAPPGPSPSTVATSASPAKGTPSSPAPVAVPQSGRETPFRAEDQQSGSMPSPTAAVVNFSTANSAPASRAPSESEHAQKDANQLTSQGQNPSPRARALAEALFGSGEPSPISSDEVRPLSAPLPNSPSTPGTPFVLHVKQLTPDADLEVDVGRKAAAATAALKNGSEASSLALRRKPTKKIQTSQISGPQLLSASMSVDAIHLASPVSTVMPASPISQQDASSGSNSRASGRGLLGRLRSLRKPQQNGALEPIETASSSLARQDSLSPSGQTIVYHPPTLHTPEVRSVPPPGTAPSSPPQHQWPQSAGPTRTSSITSPSGGLKGFMTRLRQAKGSARKEEAKSSLATPSIAEVSTSSLPLHHRDTQSSPSHQPHHQSLVHPLQQIQPAVSGTTSGTTSPLTVATPQEEEEAVDAFRRAAKSLGLEDEMINGFLLQRTHSLTRSGPSDTRRREGANSPPVAPSPPSRQGSTRVKPMEANVTARARVMREGVDPLSTVVRRTIIVPSTSASAFPASSNVITEGRNASPVLRKSSTRRRPASATSQHSTKSPVTDRVPTPPPPRGGRRFSEDNRPPMPSLPGTSSPQPTPVTPSSHTGGYESPSSNRPSIDNAGIDLNDATNMRGGVGIEVVELANGEVIWSVLDTLRGTQAPLDVDEDDSSLYFRDRLSVISHYTEPTEELQMTFRHAHRSPSRGAAHQPSTKATDTFRPETKVFYSDAKDITRLIEQITNGADSGSFNLVPKSAPVTRTGGSFSTIHTTRTEDLPVEDQLDRFMQRVGASESP